MAKKKQKFYVVWKGHCRGVFSEWSKCRDQIAGFSGAQYKSFETRADAEKAFRGEYEEYRGKQTIKSPSRFKSSKSKSTQSKSVATDVGEPESSALAVDAACSMNVGPLEYQGVLTETGDVAFHVGPLPDGTNNVGEFLAIVHGLAHLKAEGSSLPLYSDSAVAIGWVKRKHARTTLNNTGRNGKLFELIERAEKWLRKNKHTTRILKWETRVWGEIPADFGRK